MDTELNNSGPSPLPKGPEQNNLDAVIAQSTAALAEAQAPKRPRGRPTGWRKNPQPESNATSGGPSVGAAKPVQSDVVKINEIEPLANEICKAPFDFIGWKAGVDLTPTDDESKAPAKYLAKLINAYIPDLESKDPKIFAWAAFGISYFLMGIKKVRKLLEHKRKGAKDEVAQTVIREDGSEGFEPKAEITLPTQSIDAGSFFRKGKS